MKYFLELKIFHSCRQELLNRVITIELKLRSLRTSIPQKNKNRKLRT